MGDMSSFIRESMANDDSDDNHITLSLGVLDTELSDNAVELKNSGGETPGKRSRASYAPRETRRPSTPRRSPTPRRAVRESTRRSTRGSEHLRASISCAPTPPRTRATSRRRRRQRSPTYSPPPRVRSPGPDERIGSILKLRHETHRVTKYQTGEGTFRSNVIFLPRLAPTKFRDGLTPSQLCFLSKRQSVNLANWGTPESHTISIYNCPPSVQINISNYQICEQNSERAPRVQ